jgi:hypothetical protein
VEAHASTRAEAEREALVTAVQEALTEFMQAQAKHPAVEERIRKELSEIQRRHYKPLVKRWKLLIDDSHTGQHYLEGRVVLDRDVLQLWATRWLKELSEGGKGKAAVLQHRLSVYIAPVSLKDAGLSKLELRLREEFMYALQKRLDQRGYDIKKESQRAQAQYVLKLADAEYDRRGLLGSMAFTVEILDNRADGSLLATAYGSADASLQTTEITVRKELAERASKKVAAELHRKFEELATSRPPTEIVLYASDDISRRRAGPSLIDGLADIFAIRTDDEFDQFVDAIDEQVTKEAGRYLFSYRIPGDYKVSSRHLKESLPKLHARVLGGKNVQIATAAAGRKWLVFDEADRPKDSIVNSWMVTTEALIRAGKLDNPPGVDANALDTVRHQLRKDPANPQAYELLARIADVYVRRSYDAMDRDQPGQANRYLNRAEYVLGDVKAEPLDESWHAIRQARETLLKKPPLPPTPQQPQGSPDTVLVSTLMSSNPQIVFPDLEAKLRGLQSKKVAKVAKVVALAADPDGINRITANGTAVTFRPAAHQYGTYLDLPGAKTQQFFLPHSLEGGTGRIEVSVTDSKGNTTKRAVRVADGKASVLVMNPSESGRIVVEKGRFWALLIGNQNYSNGVAPLATPHRDVEHLQEVLVQHYAFAPDRVVVVKDATRDQMLVALDRMHDQVKGNDSLLIFYAGHGHQDKGFGGKGFWIPVDGMPPWATEKSPRTTWLPNSQVHDILQASRAKHILLISDSCYSGTFRTRSIGVPSGFAANLEFFYKLIGKESRRAITSGDLEPVADGGAEGHSIFAYHLIKQLERPGGAVNGERLFQRIRGPVESGSKQHPQYFTIQGAGDDGGDFVFIPGS